MKIKESECITMETINEVKMNVAKEDRDTKYL